ncbi:MULTISPECIES: CYTH domain-containing protein [Trichocoleus]|uniref:CYTH domain-containing protein n=1 Tax=Trichocoleus desertorum GB2-A4 TaxID=2933944 RepID=A0ABV0JGI5_9CYAN|nr:CYTH domain-containing protein [Trichocoleus sp. FACHB-46]MBD1864572.1 CYTH domain-containing protein [Trichocoleus sp. FACHB-46]
MATEIERKFLVKPEEWQQFQQRSDPTLLSSTRYRQGYISSSVSKTVRIRVAGDRGFITIKGPTVGYSRSEFEYSIPLADAEAMLDQLCEPPLIEKTRHRVAWDNLVWEVDEFAGENQGLMVAEVELSDTNQAITLPDWVGEEVSDDPRYFNASLAKHPYSRW